MMCRINFIFFAFSFSLLGIAMQAQSDQCTWTVNHIINGDTFYATEGTIDVKFRLIGVDTPEYSHFGKPEEPYAEAATEFLYNLISDREVILKQGVDPLDKYGRSLVYVYLEDGTFVNAELMKYGWATTMTIAPNVSFAETFLELQSEARTKRIGIWQE